MLKLPRSVWAFGGAWREEADVTAVISAGHRLRIGLSASSLTAGCPSRYRHEIWIPDIDHEWPKHSFGICGKFLFPFSRYTCPAGRNSQGNPSCREQKEGHLIPSPLSWQKTACYLSLSCVRVNRGWWAVYTVRRTRGCNPDLPDTMGSAP